MATEPLTLDHFDTPWRRMAAAIFAPPRDGKVFGSLEIDVTESIRFVEQKRAEGVPITMTHMVVAALGRCLADEPQLHPAADGRAPYAGITAIAAWHRDATLSVGCPTGAAG